MDLAQETEKAEAVKTHLTESRKVTTQKRGKDAVLREKVRRDYQALVQNLHHLTVEERKLKANQTKCYPVLVLFQNDFLVSILCGQFINLSLFIRKMYTYYKNGERY